MSSRFSSVSDKFDFSSEESRILDYWTSISAFETSMKLNQGKPVYTFYDGPPFATGLPHYGHILAGTIKDTVTRYYHQTGHSVDRTFGWDCHGLPIEYEIDQKFGLKTKEDVLKMGIPTYNAECRAIVQRYTKEWESTVKRMGRWIDFQRAYKTMDTNFMESVWNVFSQLWEKGLVYRGYKVMPYSTGCTTPLSNFEAGLNYKDVMDPAVVVSFPLLKRPDTAFLAWTTTPWTLPSNFALIVNPKMKYVRVRDVKSGAHYILAQVRLEEIYPKKKGAAQPAPKDKEKEKEKYKGKAKPKEGKVVDGAAEAAPAESASAAAEEADKPDYEITDEYMGTDLVGMEYEPLFQYFASERQSNGAFRVISGDFVTDDSGTGIVHAAPAFGEDDYRCCADADIIKRGAKIICPVDDSGRFTSDVTEFAGRYVKEADKDIIRHLKERNRMIKQGQIFHSYPHCWRSETPLLYRAVPSWFVNVEKVKERLLACNDQTYWVPSFVKEKRFHNWLRDARDWSISRNRYWGTPLPIWTNADCSEVIVIDSVAKLEQLSGVKGITDIHKDKIEHITIQGKTGPLKMSGEIFDCWFESGSMPYAQKHYPFENKEEFEKSFPADFIAEGLDQTRGWFYTLMVISTCLFDKPAFKNLICNGLVLASDGKKMSKRLKNYPDPLEVVKKYGADALRVYLVNSPVVRAEPLRFNETGVFDVVKLVFLPWFHAYRFFIENAQRFEATNHIQFEASTAAALQSKNVMDRWILAALNSLIKFVREEMAAYRLYTVVPRLLSFIEQLTNWYVKMNRKRLKGHFGVDDCRAALNAMFHVLYSLTRLMAPFTPFLVESMYQNLKSALPEAERMDSVHYLAIPETNDALKDDSIERIVSRMQAVVELGRTARAMPNRNISLKKPIKHLLVVHKEEQYLDDVRQLAQYVREELNVRTVEFSSEEEKFIQLKAEPNRKALGQRLGKKSPEVCKAIVEMKHDMVKQLKANGSIEIAGEKVTSEEVEILWQFVGDKKTLESCGNNEVLVVINCEIDADLLQESYARELLREVQNLRKTSGLQPSDQVEVFYEVQQSKSKAGESSLDLAVKNYAVLIRETLGREMHPFALRPCQSATIGQNTVEIDGQQVQISLTTPSVVCSEKAIAELAQKEKCDAQWIQSMIMYVGSMNPANVQRVSAANAGALNLRLDGRDVTLQAGKHFFFSVSELVKAN